MDLVGDNPGPLAELWNLNKGCWVVPLWRDIPDNDNAEIQSSSLARDSSSQAQIHNGIRKEECSQNQRRFTTYCFYER